MKKEKPEKEEKKQTEPAVKSMTPEERKRLLLEGIKKTVVPAVMGAFFAVIFFFKFGDAAHVSYFLVLLLVILVSYYIQRFSYPLIGVKVEEFQTKDWMYVEFFTVIFFLVFWILMLNIGTLEINANPTSVTVGVPGQIAVNVMSNGMTIEGAVVYLNGSGINMSGVTEKDSPAIFNNVNAVGIGNLTLTASKKGYASGHKNITVRNVTAK